MKEFRKYQIGSRRILHGKIQFLPMKSDLASMDQIIGIFNMTIYNFIKIVLGLHIPKKGKSKIETRDNVEGVALCYGAC